VELGEGKKEIMDEEPTEEEELSDLHQAFVDEYTISRNATEAYEKVYDCTWESANANGPRLKKQPAIQAAIIEAMEAASKRAEITQDDILRELGKIAFQDIRKLYDPAGNLLPVHLLDDDTAASVAGIEVVELFGGGKKDDEDEEKKAVVHTKKVKTWDKRAALVDYGKYFGMFKDVTTGPDGGPLQHTVNYHIKDPKEIK